MRVTNAVSLSHVEFDIVWERLGLGERPYPIEVPSFGETIDERAILRQQVWQALEQRGLHDGRDLDPRLEDLLVLLVRNRFSVDGRLSVGAGPLRFLAAVKGDHGLLAVQSDSELRLEQVRATGIVRAVVALLPDEQPGPGGAVAMPRAVFDEAADAYARGGYLAFEAALNKGGVVGRDMRAVSTLVDSGRHGGGQLAASSVDRLGRRTRTPVLNWFDTDAGRYLVYAERRRDGGEWLTFAPADSGRIARRLTELVVAV